MVGCLVGCGWLDWWVAWWGLLRWVGWFGVVRFGLSGLVLVGWWDGWLVGLVGWVGLHECISLVTLI